MEKKTIFNSQKITMKLSRISAFLFLFFLVITIHSHAQEHSDGNIAKPKDTFDINEVVEIEEEEPRADVPFAVVEDVPVYPGCEGLEANSARKKCMSDKVKQLVNENFVIPEEDQKAEKSVVKRIYANFKIDSKGNVSNIKVRALGGSSKLEEEAIRVLKLLPKMQPGKQRGKAVGVMYSIPIVYRIAGKNKEKK